MIRMRVCVCIYIFFFSWIRVCAGKCVRACVLEYVRAMISQRRQSAIDAADLHTVTYRDVRIHMYLSASILHVSLRGQQPPSVTGTYAIETTMLTRTTWYYVRTARWSRHDWRLPPVPPRLTSIVYWSEPYILSCRKSGPELERRVYSWMDLCLLLHYIILIKNISPIFNNKNDTTRRTYFDFIYQFKGRQKWHAPNWYWRPRTVTVRNSGFRVTNVEK